MIYKAPKSEWTESGRIRVYVITLEDNQSDIPTKFDRWMVHDKSGSPILFEVKRSNVKVGVSLHSSECQSFSFYSAAWHKGHILNGMSFRNNEMETASQFLDSEDGSKKATLVGLLLVGISSLKIAKDFLIRSGVQRNFAHTFVLTFPTDLPSRVIHLFSN